MMQDSCGSHDDSNADDADTWPEIQGDWPTEEADYSSASRSLLTSSLPSKLWLSMLDREEEEDTEVCSADDCSAQNSAHSHYPFSASSTMPSSTSSMCYGSKHNASNGSSLCAGSS